MLHGKLAYERVLLLKNAISPHFPILKIGPIWARISKISDFSAEEIAFFSKSSFVGIFSVQTFIFSDFFFFEGLDRV